MKDLSLIIKCYNEAPHLLASLKEVMSTLKASCFSYEIIFVEDKSTDNTKEILKNILPQIPNSKVIFHEENMGHGQCMIDAVKIADAKVVGFIDIDLEVSSRYIPFMVASILDDGFQIATGYRFYALQFSFNAVLRQILSLGYRFLYRNFLGIPLSDPETGYKFFNRVDLEKLLVEVKNPGWFWDTEIMSTAYLHGYRIREVPCLFLRRTDKKTTIRVLSYTVRQFKELVRFRKTLAERRSAQNSQALSLKSLE